MSEQNNESIFETIWKKIIFKEINESFSKRGFLVKEIIIQEASDIKTSLKLILANDKIIVEQENNKIQWKLNALPMGEVMGKDISDVAGDYEYQQAKNKR